MEQVRQHLAQKFEELQTDDNLISEDLELNKPLLDQHHADELDNLLLSIGDKPDILEDAKDITDQAFIEFEKLLRIEIEKVLKLTRIIPSRKYSGDLTRVRWCKLETDNQEDKINKSLQKIAIMNNFNC